MLISYCRKRKDQSEDQKKKKRSFGFWLEFCKLVELWSSFSRSPTVEDFVVSVSPPSFSNIFFFLLIFLARSRLAADSGSFPPVSTMPHDSLYEAARCEWNFNCHLFLPGRFSRTAGRIVSRRYKTDYDTAGGSILSML